MNKTFVEFFFPGSFVSETTAREVIDRSTPKDIPNGAYGYRFYSQQQVELGDETLRGEPKDYSGTTYFGKAMTLDEVAALPIDTTILQSNMRCNGWARVVRTIRGNFQPLTANDTVIDRPEGR